MSLKDKAVQDAEDFMQRSNPSCPECGSKGAWKFGNAELLQKPDPKTDVRYLSLMVAISCAKCGKAMPDFEADN
jgi:endogenous inhibitor of DNA gyrase (YacG/DUF329 family)